MEPAEPEPEGMTLEEMSRTREAINKQARLTEQMFWVMAVMGDKDAAAKAREFAAMRQATATAEHKPEQEEKP